MKTNRDSINRIKLYLESLKFLGQDASPFDEAPDEYGCADSLSKVINTAFPKCLSGSVSTAILYKQLLESSSFIRVKTMYPGDIIICPTGFAKKPSKITNGHCGIIGEDEQIMSNSSATGTWEQNYTIESWVKRYRNEGNYPIYIFRKV
jgi:hypothetical protein